jgi:hypothetical protein
MDINDYDDFSFLDSNSIMNYIRENFIQILLFILVFVIIYVVDYISNINAIIFAIPSPVPGLQQQQNNKLPQVIKIPKRRRSSKKH